MELEEEELHSGGIDVGQTKTPDSPCSMYYYPHFPDERMGGGKNSNSRAKNARMQVLH